MSKSSVHLPGSSVFGHCRLSVLMCFVAVFLLCPACVAGSWPTYRCDIRRSGLIAEKLGPEVSLQWVFESVSPPKPAWPMPAEELPRTHFDDAYHVAAADGAVYFGCSVTGKVYSIDAASGKIRWTFYAEGPVRLAPALYDSRLYFGSDDGYVYCLDAADGRLLWKYRAGPTGEKVIGNGRMISLWPVRTSVLVDDGVVYFAAGVFPHEGIYICALSAGDGTVIWKNTTIGDRAHDLDFGGISPQGYLVASPEVLYVPSGRAMPAAFDRKTGNFLFYSAVGGKRGGVWALLDGDSLIAGVEASGRPSKVAYDGKTGRSRGDAFGWFAGVDMVLTAEVAYVLSTDGIYAIDRAKHSTAVEKARVFEVQRDKLGKELAELRSKLRSADEQTGNQLREQMSQIARQLDELAEQEKQLKDSSYGWHWPAEGFCSLIMAGDILLAGGQGRVAAVDVNTGAQLWQQEVPGKAVGLAVADGRLFVSTDKGHICCFGGEKRPEPLWVKTPFVSFPYPADKDAVFYESAAKQILQQSSVEKGYCLVLDCGIGRLAFELARQTDLQIVGIEKDAEKLAVARKNLEAAGLLGTRVVVEPWDVSELPDYFANLIVSDGMLFSGRTGASESQINRVLRPYGGVALLGSKRWFGRGVSWKKLVRGELAGAGAWTHQYADTCNTACSGDELVRGPLGILWFGEPGPQRMVERHARAASSVSANGRLFIEGEEVIMAYDAYNGALLWEREIPGAVRVRVDVDGGNLALTDRGLYVAAYDRCYRLDPAGGEIMRTYELPPSPQGTAQRWGYIAADDRTLYGSITEPLKNKYAFLSEELISDGQWKQPEQIQAGMFEARGPRGGSYRDYYERYKSRYPIPDENLRKDWQRSGTSWRGVDGFAGWGSQRSAADSVTERLQAGEAVFALDARTGKVLWTYLAKRIPNISITVADGMAFFVESTLTAEECAAARQQKLQLIEKGVYEQGTEAQLKENDADVRVCVALNATTGEVLWKKPLDLTGCGGDKMGTAYRDGVLLFFGHFSNHDTGFFKNGELTWRRITALDAKTGDVLWSRPLNYLRRPLVVGNKIIIEPRACELRTGRIVTRAHPITDQPVPWQFLRPGHSCSITSASAHTLFYRSYSGAIYDLTEDRGLELFGAIRPGCWLNMVSANGLMLMPEASSGCTCSFPVRCSIALVHKPSRAPGNWTVFIDDSQMTPAKHLAVNFGAPGDIRDAQGTMWFGYPRPVTVSPIGYGRYGVRFDLREKVIDGMGPFRAEPAEAAVGNTDKPWLFASGYRGLLRCELPLLDDGKDRPASYTVRLGFKPLPGDRPGQRVFDVKLQDRTVLKSFDILRPAGKAGQVVVKQFKGVQVRNSLVLELVPNSANPGVEQAPLINFVEVVREDVPSVAGPS